MKKISALVVFSLIALIPLHPHVVNADIEWATKKQLELKATPLDSAASADGKLLFILTPGEVIVYSSRDEQITKRIPVDKDFDRLSFSSADTAVILTSSAKKSLKIIQLEFVHNLDIAGLPVKGPGNAAVTIAVFSDYQ